MSETRDDLREALDDLCDRLDRQNTVTAPQACADTMDEARTAILSLRAGLEALVEANAALATGEWTDVRQLEAEAQVSALQAEVERERHNKEQWRDLSYENAQAADRLSAEAKRLNALLAPFVAYAKAHQRSMWGSGEIGGVIGPDGLRCAIRDSDLMALLEAPSDNPLTETKEGSDAP